MAENLLSDQGVIGQLAPWLQHWLELERFHLHRADRYQDRSRDPGFEVRYLPQHAAAFRLPCFWVPRRSLQVYGRQTAAGELDFFAGSGADERVLFPIHPSAIDHYRTFLADAGAEDAAKRGQCIWALPTSSTRTLLVWQDQAPQTAVFVKTSLHSPLFGDRRLLAKSVGRSVGLSGLVQGEREELPDALSCLREPVGFAPRSSPELGGAVIRSIPPHIKQGHIRVAPLFSLLGGDGDRVPLMLTLLERSGMQPLQWLEQVLCAPFARLWAELSLGRGLILEAHGQDLLLQLTPDLAAVRGFLYRDFEGLQVDWELRRQRGWPTPANMPHDWSWRETYDSWNYPLSDLVWYKWWISLFNYLRLVLFEVETSLREWHDGGLVRGPKCGEGELTMLFSRHLFAAIERQFNQSPGAPYDVLGSLNRFLIQLKQLRRASMQGPPGGAIDRG